MAKLFRLLGRVMTLMLVDDSAQSYQPKMKFLYNRSPGVGSERGVAVSEAQKIIFSSFVVSL
jgi:hypothetical protein